MITSTPSNGSPRWARVGSVVFVFCCAVSFVLLKLFLQLDQRDKIPFPDQPRPDSNYQELISPSKSFIGERKETRSPSTSPSDRVRETVPPSHNLTVALSQEPFATPSGKHSDNTLSAPVHQDSTSSMNISMKSKESSRTDSNDWFTVQLREPSNLTRLHVPGDGMWSMDTFGKWRYSGLSNRRRTHQGVLKCLANKHILLTGDSRTRFQYLSLVVSLAQRVFPQCNEWQHFVQNVSGPLWLCGEWREWSQEQINQAMRTAESDEACFCYRPIDWGTFGASRTREDRFFTMRTAFGEINISFTQILQDWCTLELGFPPFNQGQDVPCSPGMCSTLVNSSLILNERRINGTVNCVKAVVEGFSKSGHRQNNSSTSKAAPVTHVFAHAGWPDTDIGCEILDFRNKTKIPSWVLGPPTNFGDGLLVPRAITRHGCHVPYFDRAAMTAGLDRLYLDALHVTTSVNEEFNHKLLDTLCGDPSNQT